MGKRIHSVAADIRYSVLFECDGCGETEIGGTLSKTVSGPRVRIEEELHRLPMSNESMPIGWASFAEDSYRCPACIRARVESEG